MLLLATTAQFSLAHLKAIDLASLRLAGVPGVASQRISEPDIAVALTLTQDVLWVFFDGSARRQPRGLASADVAWAAALTSSHVAQCQAAGRTWLLPWKRGCTDQVRCAGTQVWVSRPRAAKENVHTLKLAYYDPKRSISHQHGATLQLTGAVSAS